MNKLFKKLSAGFLSIAATLVLAVGAHAATTIVVSGDTAAGENQPGWLFNRDASTATPFEFNTDAASIGTGSLYVLPIGSNPSDKFIGENFLLSPIADINSISYDFKIGGGGDASDANQFYMNVYANFGESDPEKFYDCRYDIVPVAGSTTDFTTVTFDPAQAYPVTTRTGASASPFTCPSVPADMNTLSAGSTIRVFALNVGDTSVNDEGLDGYLDNVVVDNVSDVLVYDFELEGDEPSGTVPLTKDECKDGGWMSFSDPSFKNQGQCVSFVASEGKSMDNPGKNR